MIPALNQNTFLKEHGVEITRNHLRLPDGKTFTWASVSALRTTKDNSPVAVLMLQAIKYRLFLGTNSDPSLKQVFETEDAQLFERIQAAINQAARAAGAPERYESRR